MLENLSNRSGKVTIATLLSVVVLVGVALALNVQQTAKTRLAVAQTDTATTSVTVLNIAPVWTNSPKEDVPSSTSSPSNSSTTITIHATGTDGNGEDYYLLICNNDSTPTANPGAAPVCNGGTANQYGVSTSTASGNQASVNIFASSSYPETNEWYAWICDANAGLPACNSEARQGDGGGASATASPFVVNHPPHFTGFYDDSPVLPDGTVRFYATTSDEDVLGGQDTVQLFVCQTAAFSGSTCTGASWATSTASTTNQVAIATNTIAAPLQDQNYGAYLYVIDEHGHASVSSNQGSDSVLTISNATPTISSSSISLLDTDDVGVLEVNVESAETTGFEVRFTISDDNSCVANASTTAENSSAAISVYRSGVGSTTCDEVSEYNPNNCYPREIATTTWNVVCAQSGTCSGPDDFDVEWSCTFPLWHIADPTDVGTQYPSENWLAFAQATDDDNATSTYTEAQTGNELQSFLAFDLGTTGIPYGSLQPGNDTVTLIATTSILATGNVGVDQNLSGTNMCTTYPTCTNQATNTIPSTEQEYATTTATAYGSGTDLSSTTPTELEVNVPKSISTSTATTSDIYWGINIPIALTLSGDYEGVNTFTGVVGESSDW